MKRLLAAAAAATVAVLATAPTYAAPSATTSAYQTKVQKGAAPMNVPEHSAAGVVASYSADTRMLKLQSGSEYKLAQQVSTKPRQGDRVTVHWKYEGKERIADKVLTEP